ncbi:hypothetical protein ISF_05289 [Cordyceps fumosorosea ARSEF 2679]|uniref:Zinc finger, FYVE domain containing protein n=1 Tax=Cordyceps fumosorosea (strain ARSEF 2679) TaxID=1081104 RepID=A0A167V6I4_CORFA|nr:hypothetical protein ISF_05289 [Cordyceps fumosorosea ARSEF 2679]OAA62280.1 hypothetical protein ISF_05289 [Cordyceps fumosorosea ARSEF 2679]
MVNDVDKSLLDRLQALRGGPGGSQPSQAPQSIKVDVIERLKTPSREDALAARLRSLREGSATPEPEGQRPSPKPAAQRAPGPSIKQAPIALDASDERSHQEQNIDNVFETDDDTLQELLADVSLDEDLGAAPGAYEPSEEQVKALLEQLANDIPKDTNAPSERRNGSDDEPDSDDSDGEAMKRKVKDVMERYQDEAELEAAQREENGSDAEDFQEPHDEATHDADAAALGLPSVPSDLQHLASSPPQGGYKPGLDDMTARLAALRAPSHNTDGGGDDDDDASLALPSVPTSRPSAKGPQPRLQTRTKYTDDDTDGWCIVCLEDATLRCLGCEDENVYCARCWREMHVGPAAAFDDHSHRAVQFARDKKKNKPRKVALGA